MDLDNSVIRDELASDEKFNSVRPKNFEDFIGQTDTLKFDYFCRISKKKKNCHGPCLILWSTWTR